MNYGLLGFFKLIIKKTASEEQAGVAIYVKAETCFLKIIFNNAGVKSSLITFIGVASVIL